jgi:glycosyltransferase involved in cell wall biosynthesis
VDSRVLCLDDGSLVPPSGLSGRVNSRFDWALSGAIQRRSRGTMLSFHRRQIWNPELEIGAEDIVHLHSITGFIGDRGLRHLLRNRPRVFWTAHNPWLFTGGCVAYAGCDRFESGCKRCPLLKFPLKGWPRWELKAKVKFWRDYGVKPIANSEWMAAMMRRCPLFEGMDIPVVPPIVDEVFFATTNHTNLHERGKQFLTTIERQGGREKEQPKVGPKGEGVWTTESNDADGHGWDKRRVAPAESGLALSSQNPFAKELSRDSENSSLTRSTSWPASHATSYSLPVTAPQALWAGGSRFVVGLSARSLTDGGKGINSFFERLPLDKAFLRDTTFLLIGEGLIPVPAGINCHFVGHISSQERLAEIYRMLDLFVSASAMETFGMAILEAQACGTQVVAFETGGTPEAVCPVASKLVRNGDWAGLFREVEAMFDSAVKGSGKNHELSDWVVKKHSWQAIVEKQIAIYGNL